MTIISKNPYSEEILQSYEEHDDQYINAVLEKANSTFLDWKETTFAERTALMHNAADIMRGNEMHYARLMTQEMGKHLREAKSEIQKCAMCCDYYADNSEKFLANEPLEVPEGKAYIAHDPIGVILAVMPWNFPYWQVIRFAAPALMAGNVGILKHASNVPQCALALEEIFRKAGFPDGCFTSLIISSGKVNEIIDHPYLRAATLTGSEKAGSKVAERAGARLKKTVLELGGSDPFIVLEDAEIEISTDKAVKSRMINGGQSCIAAKRFIIHEKIYDKWVETFVNKVSTLKFGNPEEEDVDYGPMASAELAKELQEQVDKSVKMGAKVLLKGGLEKGSLFQPMILAEIPENSPAHKEELFGPVALLWKGKDDNEIIKIANDSPFGLGGSLWTKDIERGQKMVRKIDSGAIYINKMMASHPAVPFGGVKNSGYGRELSYLGIREFVNQKSVWIG